MAGEMSLKLYIAVAASMLAAWFLAVGVTWAVYGTLPRWGITDILIMVAALFIYSCVHEVWHWWMAKILGINASIHVKPYGFYVDLGEEFHGTFASLTRDKKVKYSLIAVAPYPFTYTLALVCVATGPVLPGLALAFTCTVNFFLEWVVT